LRGDDGNLTDGGIYVAYLISPIAIAITLTLMFKCFGGLQFKEVYNFKCHPKYYIIGLLLIYGLLFSLSMLNEYFIEFLQLFGYTPNSSGSIPSTQGWLLFPAIIVIAVLPAIMEEALFRGVILGGVEEDAGSIKAIFIVGFLFSLFHGSAEQTIYQFICGCVFAFLAIRSRSILPTILIHFINNALIIVLYAFNMYDESGALAISQGANIAIMVTSAICLVVGLLLLIFDKTPLKKGTNGGVKKVFIFASVGIFIMALMWILNLFM
jgi:membrane protease YdiL (CAAX protease family)